jgi:hypothetical protein
MQAEWGRHSIDRFMSMDNTHLPRFDAKWCDPKCEEIDCLHFPNAAWQREANYYNPPWGALPALCAKLHQSKAEANVITPHWPHKPWFQQLHSIKSEAIHYPATQDIFFP